MTTRTYRINLVGEPADTARALAALERLFDGEALNLLRGQFESTGLTVQRLVADNTEVVLYITRDAAEAAPVQASPRAAARSLPMDVHESGTMGTEDPPR